LPHFFDPALIFERVTMSEINFDAVFLSKSHNPCPNFMVELRVTVDMESHASGETIPITKHLNDFHG
jgi:hypothetical protein